MMTPETIKALRDARDWSQQVLADTLGVDQATVSRWEKGKAPPSGPARKMLERLMSDGAASGEAA